jgi:branched-chain amino acid transport system ATP-binding protein
VDPVLIVDSLASGYGDLRAVWDVSFSALPGEVVVILGRNGAGKTTTLRAIVGLNPLLHGTIRFMGDDIGRLRTHDRARRGMALVQEGKRIFRRRTVEQNLMVGAYRLGLSKAELREAIEVAYTRFPALKTYRTSPGGSLSGGQQQMLAIAQALMGQPKLLLIDEPSGGLAPAIVSGMMETIRGLAKEGTAVVLVEQAVEQAVAIADRVVVMDLGRIALDQRGPIEDIDAVRQAYLGVT